MRKWLNIYFNFSKREYNGLLVMIVIMFIIRAIPSVYDYLVPEEYDLVAEKQAILKLELEEEKAGNRHYKKNRPEKVMLFKFDPNHAGADEWQSLGLSAKQAAAILKYTAKGGRFRRKEDLRKMYTISPELYERLAPYVRIGAEDTISGQGKRTASYTVLKRKALIVSVNTADTALLDSIKGIGPAFARRIVKYRDRLGGFYRKEQLMEVFGLDSLKYLEIKDQISVDEHQLRIIYINRIEFQELKNHPYLSYKQVNAILQFRKQHGNYSNIAALKKVAILPAETVDKLAPYISFDHD